MSDHVNHLVLQATEVRDTYLHKLQISPPTGASAGSNGSAAGGGGHSGAVHALNLQSASVTSSTAALSVSDAASGSAGGPAGSSESGSPSPVSADATAYTLL